MAIIMSNLLEMLTTLYAVMFIIDLAAAYKDHVAYRLNNFTILPHMKYGRCFVSRHLTSLSWIAGIVVFVFVLDFFLNLIN